MSKETREGFINLSDEQQLLAYWSSYPNLPELGQIDSSKCGVSHEGDCPKCAMRAMRDALGENVKETFAAKLYEEPVYILKSIVDEKTGGKTPRVIPTPLLRFLVHKNEFVEAHVAHVAHVGTPGAVVFGAFVKDNEPTMFAWLVDGTHRAVAALRSGREYKAYCLNARETAACVMETKKRIDAGGIAFLEPVGEVK